MLASSQGIGPQGSISKTWQLAALTRQLAAQTRDLCADLNRSWEEPTILLGEHEVSASLCTEADVVMRWFSPPSTTSVTCKILVPVVLLASDAESRE